MSVIYEPKGRAREYAALATNVYIGCDHACSYCYAPSALQTSRSNFIQPHMRNGYLDSLRKEARIMASAGKNIPQVLFSFACDPYSVFNESHRITRQALEILSEYGLRFCILTKGGMRATQDIDLFRPGDSFAATLTFMDAAKSTEWEPGAAEPLDRIQALRTMHAAGVETWASLEPVLDPAETLAVIQNTHEIIDLYKVGKLNHHALAATIDWVSFGVQAIELLEALGKTYYIKDDLRSMLPQSALDGAHRRTQQQIEQAHMSIPAPRPVKVLQASLF